MPYPEELIAPMRQDLVQLGFQELKTADQVDAVLGTEQRTTVVAINSVCGCSAGGMRPGVAVSLGNEIKPDVLVSVFAGQDLEATERAREYFTGYPPSSPAVAASRMSGKRFARRFQTARPDRARWVGAEAGSNAANRIPVIWMQA